MTAPVTGSWGEPAWTARVPNLWTGDGARGGVSMGAWPLMILLRPGTVIFVVLCVCVCVCVRVCVAEGGSLVEDLLFVFVLFFFPLFLSFFCCCFSRRFTSVLWNNQYFS